MALLAVKNALFPSSRDQNSRAPLYRRVSYADDDDDLEPGTGNARSKSSNEKETDSVFSDSSSRFDARYVSDATIGLSDGLTVPFALTAGLSALGDSKVVIIGGLAELIAGSISMGLGGYLGARSEAEAYQNTLDETRDMARRSPAQASSIVQQSLAEWELPGELCDAVAGHLEGSTERTTAFLMRFHHGMQDTQFEARRAYFSALTIALHYFFGGFIPLTPYFFVGDIAHALTISVGIMIIALFVFGYAKTRLVGQTSLMRCSAAGLQMILLGGIAAGAAVACVRLASYLDGTAAGG